MVGSLSGLGAHVDRTTAPERNTSWYVREPSDMRVQTSANVTALGMGKVWGDSSESCVRIMLFQIGEAPVIPEAT